MVNWQSPETMVANAVVTVKLTHAVSGIYLWEWLSNVGFDYKIVTNPKVFKWPMAVYLGCRICALLMVVMALKMVGGSNEINCGLWFTCLMAFAYIGVILSSILIALRAIAIWNRNKYVVWPISLALVGYTGIVIRGVVDGPVATWNPLIRGCNFSHTLDNRVNYTYGMIFDAGTLAVAFVGVLGYGNATRGSLLRAVYRQGITWILAVVTLYAMPLIFLWLNLNDVMNVMFQIPAGMSTVIASTMMYRELYERAHSDVPLHIDEPTNPNALRMVVDDSLSTEESSSEDRRNYKDLAIYEMNRMKSASKGAPVTTQ